MRQTALATVSTDALPSRHLLLSAISGRLTNAPELLDHARELADLHASLIPAIVDPHVRDKTADTAFAEIVARQAQIDSWAVFHLPRHPGATFHTQSLGEVLNHVARIYAHVWWSIRHTDDEEQQHDAWLHLGEVMRGYADLRDAVLARRTQLPLGWTGVAPRLPSQPRMHTNT
ncbi:hypothetical protein [Nocardia brasiliensis]|uniref:hypothetical protein n=1 Tax=Nocardia brasiliensis TaxID=37326 RepID=UPI00366A9183